MVKVRKNWKRALASVMTFAMLLTSVYTVPVSAEETVSGVDVTTVSGSDVSGGNAESGTTDNTITTYECSYDFRNTSIVSADASGSGSYTSADGNLTAANCTYHSGGHGDIFNTGNTITIKVFGNTTISVGKCSYSSGTVTLSKDGTVVGDAQSLANATCAKNDATQVVTFNYVGESSAEGYDLVLTFDGQNYVPFVNVAGEKPVVADDEPSGDVPSGDEPAEEPSTEGMVEYKKTYDFRDGSIVPTDTDGKSDVTSVDGTLTVKVGTQNAYGYNGGTHGTQFKAGNSIEIKIPAGQGNIVVGNCGYSADGTIDVTLNGEALGTLTVVKGGSDAQCYRNATEESPNALSIAYASETDMTAVLAFNSSTYVPVIMVDGYVPAPQVDMVEFEKVYDFRDGSIVPTTTDGKSDVTSVDGSLTVKVGTQNAYGYNGATHGTQFKAGNSIDIKVPAGSGTITIGNCGYSADGTIDVTMNGESLGTLTVVKGGSDAQCYRNATEESPNALTVDYECESESVVTLAFNSSTYVPVIIVSGKEAVVVEMSDFVRTYDFRDGSIVPTTTDGKSDVTSVDGTLTVKVGTQNAYGYNGATHGTQFKAGNSIELTVKKGSGTITIGNCGYSADGTIDVTMNGEALGTLTVVKGGSDAQCYRNATEESPNALTIDYECEDTSTITLAFNSSTYVPVIIVSGTEVKAAVSEVVATVTFNDPNSLIGESKITLVNTSDATDVIDVTAGGDFVLKANATYKVVCDNSDIAISVNGKGIIATATEALSFTVDVVATVVHPVVTISDPDSVLGDGVVTLTNMADDTDVKTLTDGESVKLSIGATYLVASSVAAATATIDGGKTITATEDLTAFTVDVVETDMTHHTVDVWDFGVEMLEDTDLVTYNNNLTPELVLAWYDGLTNPNTGEAYKAGDVVPQNVLGYDAAGQARKLDAGDGLYLTGEQSKANKWRHRGLKTLTSIPNELCESEIVDEYGAQYQGIMYNNAATTKGEAPYTWMELDVTAGDKVWAVVSSNGTDSDITWESPSGDVQTFTFTRASRTKVQNTNVFYAAETGTYKLYSANEKLVVARIYRETPDKATVSGTVSVPEGKDITDVSIVFTNTTTGEKTLAPIVDNKYTVTLSEQYSYSLSLSGINDVIVGLTNMVTLKNEQGAATYDVELVAVELVPVSGSLADLTADAAGKLELTFESDAIYVPELTIDTATQTYTADFEAGVEYTLSEAGVDDYVLETKTVSASAANDSLNIKFTKKPVYDINVTLDGLSAEEAAKAEITFSRLAENDGVVDGSLDGYVYTFTGTENIALRDGQYKVVVAVDGYTQKVTADVKVKGAAVDKTIVMLSDSEENATVAYKETITVGATGCDYTTINDALDAVRHMERDEEQRVTISIQPGDYQEMLVVDVPNVTLKNACENANIVTIDKGANIDETSVRITSYYGHGYTYYSQGEGCKYDADLLAVNKENGYPSYVNPGSGTTDGSYWNATVVVDASGFRAEGIIFENSFNQYTSTLAADDVIVPQGGAKGENLGARNDMEAGDTSVQKKEYVERAAALAVTNGIEEVFFDHCSFIGRQDTLYGGTNSTVAFYDCDVYGGTDYIFGGMIAVFAKCDLVLNTDGVNKNDVAYITAAQQKSGRGYLMYNCNVVGVTPGVNSAATNVSQPGYFGRPWEATTSEVIFLYTVVGTANDGTSLINPLGWNDGLGGKSDKVYEYGTYELTEGTDNLASRVAWSKVLESPVLPDGTIITVPKFLGAWQAFEGKDMTITLPDGTTIDEPTDPADEEILNPPVSEIKEYVLETSTLTPFAAAAKADGDSEKAGTSKYFTLLYSAKSKVDSSSKTWDDEYASSQRVNFGGTVSTSKNAIKFTTASEATVKVWWAEGGDDNRQMGIINGNGVTVASTDGTFTKNSPYISTFELSEAGTYYLGGLTGNNYIFKVQVTETNGAEKAPRADWSTVEAPVVTNAVQYAADKSQVEVTVSANVGYDGADKVTVTLTDAKGNVVGSGSSSAEKQGHTIYITPSASGTYTVNATLIREGETDKVAKTTTVDFVLPLEAPYVSSATCMGGGKVSVEWDAVPEATKYILTVDGTNISIGTSLLNTTVTGLTIGQKYTIKVVAVRGSEQSEAGSIEVKVVNEVQRKWSFAAYGSSTNEKNNGYIGNANEGSVTVYSESGKGKIVPASTDGLAFYYTAMDPETENFTLTATVTVDSWKLSNGQEGFGLMVADAVGSNGDATAFWNNCYQNIATKIEYYHDGIGVTTDTAADKYSMKLGLGTIAKTGATAADIEAIKTGEIAMPANFLSESSTLDTSAPDAHLVGGTYNLVGNYDTSVTPTGNLEELVTTFRLQIQRNNTGYFLRYLDEDDNVISEKKYYDLERTALTQLDEDNIYVGFIASRNARITVTDIELTTIHPDDDEPAEQREIEVIHPIHSIESATFSNSSDYEFVYYDNADGQLIITDNMDNVLYKGEHTALTKTRVDLTLTKHINEYIVTFIPDPDYRPGEYQVLSSYKTEVLTHTVEYKNIANKYIYVSPDAETLEYEMDAGTREHPLNIYTAVKVAAPGQKIVLMEGTYNLESTLKIERGINGTADNMIYMVADPAASSRPVLDFGGLCAGMIIAGDYWYFQGFDVTRSADAQKGIQVSGNNNVLDNLRTYRNGNTGIQISRYKGTDEWEDWPANNLILNCTSYLNADKGYEDADGFAAKLTVADGNVFDGCIAAYNADDGWDLYAKVQTGSIGNVTIKNSVAFKNGYLIGANGNEINAGNGNGFKMGGDSMPGQHVLENSIAFANKAKGIDSNSGPDIQAYNCTSFDNESYNVAFYTNTAVNTAYKADGVLSYKKSNSIEEQIKLKGTQVQSDVYGETNYYFNGSSSVNSASALVSDAWFVNLDTKAAITGITRNADGTINMNGYLELTNVADPNAGARMTGTPSAEIEVPTIYVQTSKVDPFGSAEKLEAILKDAVEALKDVIGCDNASELANYLINKALQVAHANNINASEGSMQILEVKVKILAEVNGKMQYVEATADNFPEEGVDVLLPYPNGTGMHDKFNVSHLVVLGCNGQVPGTMENCRYQATKDGLLVHAMSASPFVITWPEGSDDDADNSVDDGSNSIQGSTTTENGTTNNSGSSKDKLVASAEKVEGAKAENATKTETTTKEEKPATTDKADSKTETAKTQEENVKDEVSKDEVKVDDKADSTAVVEPATADATGNNVWGILIAIAVVAVIGLAVGVFVRRKKGDTLE